MLQIIFDGVAAGSGYPAGKGEYAMPFNQFPHLRNGLCRIVLVVSYEIMDLPSVDSAFLVDQVKKKFCSPGDSPPMLQPDPFEGQIEQFEFPDHQNLVRRKNKYPLLKKIPS